LYTAVYDRVFQTWVVDIRTATIQPATRFLFCQIHSTIEKRPFDVAVDFSDISFCF
jgi:5-formyltetrahydrofolate cyclo-ligase